MSQRVILDTSVLWDPRALGGHSGDDRPMVVPVIAFIERARQIQESGRTLAELWALLEANRIAVEDFELAFGLRAAVHLDKGTWDKHARDALIAGHVGPGDVLWTKNPKDFQKVGVPASQIISV